VARLADGWLASGYNTTPELFAQAWVDVQAEVTAHGRDGARFPNGIATMWCYVTEDRARADAMLADLLAPMLNRPVEQLRALLPIGSAEECAEKLRTYARAGAQRVFLWPLADERARVCVGLGRGQRRDPRVVYPNHAVKRVLDELRAFQAFMDGATGSPNPAVIRAQVIVQNYLCFVYLGEACFRALLKTSKPGSVTRRCCKYLTDNPVRAFRNAIAHSNWTYTPDFGGLVFWARKGSDDTEPPSRFEIEQRELDFWQTLSRGVAYASYTTLETFAQP
jgi:hypothetical protein